MWRLDTVRDIHPVRLILAAWLIAAVVPAAQAQQCPSTESAPQPLAAITLAGGNNQYFRYNNQTIPLIGLSSSYLCHVDQPGTAFGGTVTPNQHYCTWANYKTATGTTSPKGFIDRLQQSGLNVMRLWVGLNHSPGMERGLGKPYRNEQPFSCVPDAFNNCTLKWNLDSYDPVYWERLKCVIGYAGTKGVIVELTLFDPWSGTFENGPWHKPRNNQDIGFSSERFFARFTQDPTKADSGQDIDARREQEEFVRHAVQQLNAYPNLIWEIANEADLPWTSSAGPAGAQAARWMDRIAQIIREEEAVPGRLQHLIEVNLHTQTAIDELRNLQNQNPWLATAAVVAAHYVTVEPAKGDYGAIELIRAKHGTPGFTTRAFGFNETRSTPDPSIPSSVRAEAWEFALNEGGLYDNYNLQFRNSSGGVHTETNKIFNQLGVLKSFLQGLGSLGPMQRDACGTGCWLTGQGAYKKLEGTTCPRPNHNDPPWQGSKYWAAMHSPTWYVAYFHHSVDTAAPNNPFSRYEPPLTGCPVSYQETGIKFKPDVAATYLAEWVSPVNGTALASHCLGSVGAGATVNVPSSPTYVYDIALRVRSTPCT